MYYITAFLPRLSFHILHFGIESLLQWLDLLKHIAVGTSNPPVDSPGGGVVTYHSNLESSNSSDSEETVKYPTLQAQAATMAGTGTSSAAPMSPPLPSTVRLARLTDLPRISLVAAASFFYSPIFQYTRPHCDAYPLHAFPMDTMATERSKFQEAILDPMRVVLVVEAAFDPDESIRVSCGLRREYPKLDDDHYPKKPAGQTGIVGVASFCFPQGCKWVGEFMPEGKEECV